MRHYVTRVRMAITKKSASNKCWRGYEEKETRLTVGGKVNWYNRYGEQCECSFKN